ncbi:hypothetical protein [Hyphomicrobium denitrificans]|uniref:hypothetical protein n=1 Tax=Hyphomicrobium denitrificans TaxID=53399 RepID=UPI0005A4F7AC|nr:hypothetical protein [Hyphomicrobium denitrificans]
MDLGNGVGVELRRIGVQGNDIGRLARQALLEGVLLCHELIQPRGQRPWVAASLNHRDHARNLTLDCSQVALDVSFRPLGFLRQLGPVFPVCVDGRSHDFRRQQVLAQDIEDTALDFVR